MMSFRRFTIPYVFRALILLAFFAVTGSYVAAQQKPVKAQEISETDGIPVLIKHLPNWENVRDQAVFAANRSDLQRALGDRPVLDLVDISAGTEAVTAPYPQGKLLIVEYMTPQASVEADARFQQRLAESQPNPPVHYRRIGNYSVFVFDAPDEAAAAALLDQVKYEKTVQWLGEDPNLLKRLERAFIGTTMNVFISTVLFIVFTLGGALLTGILVGYVYFRVRETKRAGQTAFSDAGGLTRLNLDELSEPIEDRF